MSNSDYSSRGGSERGPMPKISIVSLGDDHGNGGNGAARTTRDSRSALSYGNDDDSNSDASSRGGSERGPMPKISIMSLGEEIGSGGNGAARTTHDSRSAFSMGNTDEG